MKTKRKEINIHPLIRLPDTLVLVRHSESVGNIVTRDERVRLDIANHEFPITKRGVLQAETVSKKMEQRFGKNFFDQTFVSTFTRTKQTMGIILSESKVGKDPIEDSRLDEKLDGIFHNLTGEEIESFYPEQDRLGKKSGIYHHRAPGGESGPDVEERIRSFFRDLHLFGAKKVFICCHGSWLLLLRRLLEGWSVEEYIKRKRNDAPLNCSMHIYTTVADKSYVEIEDLPMQVRGHIELA